MRHRPAALHEPRGRDAGVRAVRARRRPRHRSAGRARSRRRAFSSELPTGAETPVRREARRRCGADHAARGLGHRADRGTLADYAEDVLKPGLERINGVGQLEIVGGRERELHVWVDPRGAALVRPDRAATWCSALRAQNIDVPGGRVTRGSEELVVRTNAQARSVERDRNDLAIVHRRTARSSACATSRASRTASRSSAPWRSVDGKPAHRGGRAQAVRRQHRRGRRRGEGGAAGAASELAPAGTKVEVLIDNSSNIRGSIETVQLDLVLGAVLAVVIIFLFLRDCARDDDQRARAADVGHRHVRVREGHGLHAQHDDDAGAVAVDRHPDRRRDRGDREHRAPSHGAQGDRDARPPPRAPRRSASRCSRPRCRIVAVFMPGRVHGGHGRPVLLRVRPHGRVRGDAVAVRVLHADADAVVALAAARTTRRATRPVAARSSGRCAGSSNGYRAGDPLGAAIAGSSRSASRWWRSSAPFAMAPLLGFEFMPVEDTRPVHRERRAAHGTSLAQTAETSPSRSPRRSRARRA